MKRSLFIFLAILTMCPIIVTGCHQKEVSSVSWAWHALVAIGTLALAIAAFLAIFIGSIRKYRNRPRLVIEFEPEPPDYIKIPVGEISNPHDQHPRMFINSYFVRFRVSNKGKDPADNVEASLDELWKRHEGDKDGKYEFEPAERHIPIHLRWSLNEMENISDEKDAIFYPRINSGLDRFWNLCYSIDPAHIGHYPKEDPLPLLQVIYPEFTMLEDNLEGLKHTPAFILDTIWKPSSRSYIRLEGSYMLKVVIAASNAKMKIQHFDIDFKGGWADDESIMRNEILRVRLVDDEVAEERKRQFVDFRSPDPITQTR